jgi:hypothetical protein
LLAAQFALSKHPQNDALMRIRSEPASKQSIDQRSLSLCENRMAHSASQSSQSHPQLLLM